MADDTPASPTLQTSIGQIRTAARWMLAAFGAIGVALAIGAQFSNLGKLEGTNRNQALVGVGLTFLGLGLAIYAGGRVLIPRTRALHGLAKREEHETRHRTWIEDPALKLFREAPEPLRPFTSVQALYEERKRFLDAYSKAYAAWSEKPDAATTKALAAAVNASTTTEAVASNVIMWATYAEVLHVYKTSRWAALVGLVLSAVGLTIFALKISDVPPAQPTPAAVSLPGLKQSGSSQFKGKSLAGADLTGSDFSGADLTGTDLSGARLANTKFQRADLSKANLEGATGLTPSSVANAKWNATTCPDGRSSDDVGKSCAAHLVPQAQ
jgi:pentapeptide repeat protein